jgi:hypothetical protein
MIYTVSFYELIMVTKGPQNGNGFIGQSLFLAKNLDFIGHFFGIEITDMWKQMMGNMESEIGHHISGKPILLHDIIGGLELMQKPTAWQSTGISYYGELVIDIEMWWLQDETPKNPCNKKQQKSCQNNL